MDQEQPDKGPSTYFCSPNTSQPEDSNLSYFSTGDRGSRQGLREASRHAGSLPRSHRTLLGTRGRAPGVFLPDAGDHEAQVEGSLMAFQNLLEPYRCEGALQALLSPLPSPQAPCSTIHNVTPGHVRASLLQSHIRGIPFPVSLPPPFSLFFLGLGLDASSSKKSLLTTPVSTQGRSTHLCIPRPYFPPLQPCV